MRKPFILFVFLLALATFKGYSQSGRQVTGIVADSTGVTVPGCVVKLTSPMDTLNAATNIDGAFSFGSVKSTKFSITIQSIGFQGLKRNYTFDAGNKPANLGIIKLKAESKMLGVVQITDVNAVKIKEDTTEYKASAYPVRANASTEDVLKKLPGVDVDANGNVTAEGKQVTKVRINGKDFFGGDVQTATKNLPADVIESIQMIDDYGDQANLTHIKSGESTKVMNIIIRKDKNYGYSLSGTAGYGRDALPSPSTNGNRYTFSTNSFEFRGDQQIALLGSINNNNTNTFNFGGGGGGGGGFGGGGGGGRGNAARGGGGGAGGGSTTASTANGITDAKSIGFNFRDQWGKNLSVYGSYSFTDNSTNTLSTTLQQNNSNVGTTNNNQVSNETDGVLNHRITWNMEWKPDTINYFKFTPTYSYGSTTTNAYDGNVFSRLDTVSKTYKAYQNYSTTTLGNSNTQSYGATLLYNHSFNSHGRNFSINLTGSSAPNMSYQNPISIYLAGKPNAPQDQFVNVTSHTNSFGSNISYIEPLSKVSFLEGTYIYNYAHTTNDKNVDTLVYSAINVPLIPSATNFYDRLSNDYNYSFITNRFALNYRLIEPKYNFTIGLGIQPSELKGTSPATATQAAVNTDVKTTNFSPTLRYVYNFSRSQAFTLAYNGASSQPSYTQLNPRLDLSNASYPVQGNSFLKPQFNNTVSLRYNQFSFGTGNLLFSNISFTQANDYIAQNTTTYPAKYKLDTRLNNAILTTYTNTDGYYSGSGFFTYAKPWDKRKYTLIFNGNVTYSNTISYVSNVIANKDSLTYNTITNKNLAKTLGVTPGVRFRVDITDVIDAQAMASYGITKTNNTIASAPFSDYRTTQFGLNGKNYLFTNWTVSYDYTKTIYDGFTGNVKNPNILTAYLERRFLKNNAATIRGTVYDIFNENTGYTNTTTGTQTTQSNVNRLGRYFLLTFTLRLQKFAGKAPSGQDMPGGGGRRRDGGGPGGGGPGGGGPGGPGGGSPE